MQDKINISLLDLVMSISNVIDLMSPDVANHHLRVAYTALRISDKLRLSDTSKQEIALAGLLHDIGILSSEERKQIFEFDSKIIDDHAEAGYILLRKFRYFNSVSNIIRYHHASWSQSKLQCLCEEGVNAREIPKESHILHLADRINVLIDSSSAVLDQVEDIVRAICNETRGRFDPLAVEAFVELSGQDSFWLDLMSPGLERIFSAHTEAIEIELDWLELQDFAKLMAHVIDFRSRFTATHSSGVAEVAAALAELAGFTQTECEKIKIAGYLHDIGKLAIPKEILEKDTQLSDREYRIMKTHVYHTQRVLDHIVGLEDIVDWASHHHERLDGNGYPDRYLAHQIPLGSRIIAVADVFTALSEERPYRRVKKKHEVIAIMRQLAEQQALDSELIELAYTNYSDMELHRQRAQDMAAAEYQAFRESLWITKRHRAPERVAL